MWLSRPHALLLVTMPANNGTSYVHAVGHLGGSALVTWRSCGLLRGSHVKSSSATGFLPRAMALTTLSEDEQRNLFTQLCNVLESRLAVHFSSISNELRVLTQALLQQLRADHETAASLCHKVGMRSCNEL